MELNPTNTANAAKPLPSMLTAPPPRERRYEPMDARAEQRTDVERRFTYYPPKGDQPARYAQIRAKAKELALLMVEVTPFSREQATALTLLEESVMMANAAIARNE